MKNKKEERKEKVSVVHDFRQITEVYIVLFVCVYFKINRKTGNGRKNGNKTVFVFFDFRQLPGFDPHSDSIQWYK